MSKAIEDDKCFLCGLPARSATYDRGNGKAFIDCTNKACGEYLIMINAMQSLSSDEKMRQMLSKSATTKAHIQEKKEILTISYHGGIKAEIKPLKDVLSQQDINFFGFEGSGE